MAHRRHLLGALLVICSCTSGFQPLSRSASWLRSVGSRSSALSAKVERSAEEYSKGWVARNIPADGMMEERLELAAKAPDWTTKLFEVTVERTEESPGLGILLEEFGRTEDGVGLTLIDGLVEGGNAESAVKASGVEIWPGDTIVKACGVRTECFDYDSTVDVLGSLPPAPEPVVLQIRRLMPIPSIACTVQFPPEEGTPDKVIRLYPGQKLQRALILNGIGYPCNDDLQCLRTCGVSILKGGSLLEEKQTQERLMLENRNEPRWRLHCRATVGFINKNEEMKLRIRPDLSNIMASGRNLSELRRDDEYNVRL